MSITLYASFEDAALAEKAMGALLDHGMLKTDLSGLFPAEYQTQDVHEVAPNVKHGITTTTSGDAAAGAATGAGVGLGLGTAAALASLFIPGFGFVTGGGALVTALAALAGTTVAGAVTGGVAGFFQDQGVDQQIAADSEAAIKNGHAVLIALAPSGELSEIQITEIMAKYRGSTYARQQAGASPQIVPPSAVYDRETGIVSENVLVNEPRAGIVSEVAPIAQTPRRTRIVTEPKIY